MAVQRRGTVRPIRFQPRTVGAPRAAARLGCRSARSPG